MGAFRTTKAAVKMHTLLDLRPCGWQAADVHALDMLLPEAGAIYVAPTLPEDAFFVTELKYADDIDGSLNGIT